MKRPSSPDDDWDAIRARVLGLGARSIHKSHYPELQRRMGELEASEAQRKDLQAQLLQAQKMEALGRLAGGIAHDFNNMLTAIIGHNELLASQMDADDENRELVLQVGKAATRAAEITRQLLAFARKQPMDLKAVNLNDIVLETEGMLRRLIGERVRLVTDLGPELWSVLADPAQMQQVLVNLALNARDAMKGGGVLRVVSRNAPADAPDCPGCRDSTALEHVVLLVSDTGEGIAQEDLRRVFEPFFSTKGAAGTGLGLATVYGIVRQSGGHVSAESTLGCGSTFRVCLPRAEGHVEHARESQPRPGSPRGEERVLLVEDDQAIRSLLTGVLRSTGYAVIEAADGADALAAAATAGQAPDLVITDVVMPGVSGPRLVEALVEQYPALRVIYISGYPESDRGHKESPAGATFLAKPFSPAALLLKVREVLDGQ